MTDNRLKKIINKFLEKYPHYDFVNELTTKDISVVHKKHNILISNNMRYNSLEFTQLASEEKEEPFLSIYTGFALLTSYMDEKFLR